VAGVVVRGRFPRRRIVQAVVTNLVRHLFGGAARSWARNLGSTAPALGSMTLLLLMSGLVGLTGFALHNLQQVETGQASLLHVYLRDDATDPDVIMLSQRLQNDARVAGLNYVNKAQALERAQRIPGPPQLVGAPRWMVRGPFVVEGAITGAAAGLVAGLITFGLTFAAITAAAGAFMRFAPGVTVTVAALAAAIVLLVGLGLGSGSSLISLRRHMET